MMKNEIINAVSSADLCGGDENAQAMNAKQTAKNNPQSRFSADRSLLDFVRHLSWAGALFVGFGDPGGRVGVGKALLAGGDSPAVEPGIAPFADVGIGQGVGRVFERVAEADEAVTSAAEHLDEAGKIVGVDGIGVEEKDMPNGAADDVEFDLLPEGGAFLHVAEIVFTDAAGGFVVLLAEGIGVDSGVDVLVVIHGDGGDGVVVLCEPGLEGALFLKRESGVQVWVAEIAEGFATGLHQGTGKGFSPLDVGFELFEPSCVEADVGIGVVAEFKAGVRPHVEQGAAGFNAGFGEGVHAPARHGPARDVRAFGFGGGGNGRALFFINVEFPFVHKTNDRCAGFENGSDKFFGHRAEGVEVVGDKAAGLAGEVVESNGDVAGDGRGWRILCGGGA